MVAILEPDQSPSELVERVPEILGGALELAIASARAGLARELLAMARTGQQNIRLIDPHVKVDEQFLVGLRFAAELVGDDAFDY